MKREDLKIGEKYRDESFDDGCCIEILAIGNNKIFYSEESGKEQMAPIELFDLLPYKERKHFEDLTTINCVEGE